MPPRDWPGRQDRRETDQGTGSGGSMAARLELEGIDGGVPPDVESAAQFDATRTPYQAQTYGGSTVERTFVIVRVVVHGRSQPVA